MEGNKNSKVQLQKFANKNDKKHAASTHEQPANLFSPSILSLIDPKQPWKLLADQIDWRALEKEFDSIYAQGKGQPPKPIRLMVGRKGQSS